MHKFLIHLKEKLDKAIQEGPLVYHDKLEGFSGKKLIAALQHLSTLLPAGQCYLEIGVFRGLTLLSVASANQDIKVFGIDNFAQFDRKGINMDIINRRKNELKVQNVQFINTDYEDALTHLGEYIGELKIGLYFVDGPHDYRSQIMSLLLACEFMSDHCIILVDDSNYEHVRQANADFLACKPEFKLVFEGYTEDHPHNLTREGYDACREGWWNGVNILVRDPEQDLEKRLPKTPRDRRIYENDHLLHAAKYALALPAAANLMETVFPLRPLKLINRLSILRKEIRSVQDIRTGNFSRRNTFSKEIQGEWFHPSL